jgi:hypothetical protein
MIEVPAAALRAHHVLAEVDFASIGTNDLAQYTLAADRMQGGLATLLDRGSRPCWISLPPPATVAATRARPSASVGEAAADPLLALVLTGLGVGSLSMAPTPGAWQCEHRSPCTTSAPVRRWPRPRVLRDRRRTPATRSWPWRTKLIADLV